MEKFRGNIWYKKDNIFRNSIHDELNKELHNLSRDLAQ